MAEALVEAAPAGGYERSAAQALDADRAWRALLLHRYGIDADGGLRALLDWATSEDPTRLTDRGATEYSASVARLTSTIEGAGPVLALAAAGKSTGMAARFGCALLSTLRRASHVRPHAPSSASSSAAGASMSALREHGPPRLRTTLVSSSPTTLPRGKPCFKPPITPLARCRRRPSWA